MVMVCVQLFKALAAHEAALALIPPTVDSKQEAVATLHNGLKDVANQVRAATNANFKEIKEQLRDDVTLDFNPQFEDVTLQFINQVTHKANKLSIA